MTDREDREEPTEPDDSDEGQGEEAGDYSTDSDDDWPLY